MIPPYRPHSSFVRGAREHLARAEAAVKRSDVKTTESCLRLALDYLDAARANCKHLLSSSHERALDVAWRTSAEATGMTIAYQALDGAKSSGKAVAESRIEQSIKGATQDTLYVLNGLKPERVAS